MSFRLTADVLEICCRSAARKLVLLCLAHHAQNDGSRIYPGLACIAKVAEITERSVRRFLLDLVKIGLLSIVEHGGGRGRATQYAMNVEMVTWLRDSGADFGAIIAARVPWPECRSVTPPLPDRGEAAVPAATAKPGHGVRVSDELNPDSVSGFTAETRTLKTVNPDSGDPAPPFPPPTPPPITPPPETLSATVRAGAREAAAAAAGEVSLEAFRKGYPKPRDGEWMVWGDVEFNVWPKLDGGERRLAVESLEAFAAAVRTKGRTRLCNPKTYLVSRRFVDYHAAAAAPAMERKFVPETADVWPYLVDVYLQDNPERGRFMPGLQVPKRNGGWWFTTAQIARAHKRREEAEAGLVLGEEAL